MILGSPTMASAISIASRLREVLAAAFAEQDGYELALTG